MLFKKITGFTQGGRILGWETCEKVIKEKKCPGWKPTEKFIKECETLSKKIKTIFSPESDNNPSTQELGKEQEIKKSGRFKFLDL